MHATEKSIKKKLYGVEAFRQKGGVRVEPEGGKLLKNLKMWRREGGVLSWRARTLEKRWKKVLEI